MLAERAIKKIPIDSRAGIRPPLSTRATLPDPLA